MATGHNDFEEQRLEAIRTVAQRALVFGEFCAKHIGEEPFNDPVMHTYFLLFVLGAVDALGEDASHGHDLNRNEKLAAMREALLAFGTADTREVTATITMLDGAEDEPALNIKDAGRAAAQAWRWGENPDATAKFHELMRDPANFPREVARPVGDSDEDTSSNDDHGSS